jgi:eukaryotic-like serine/threonine-protein kinase
MIAPTNGRQWPSVDAVIEAYESAQTRGGPVDLAQFVPEADHPERLAILCELVRVDLEYSWQNGRPNRLDHYHARFPDLFRDNKWVQAVAFEEFRQRRQAGEDPSALEYRRRYGAHTLDWPSSFLDSLEGHLADDDLDHSDDPPRDERPDGCAEAAVSGGRECRSGQTNDYAERPAPFVSRNVPDAQAQVRQDLERLDPDAANSAESGLASFPRAGSSFLGFRLQSELGRGAFARVYLARQGDLADRRVALKISTDTVVETHALAQLQHTNIVPIYSVHRSGPLHAVCMPYLGSTTLAQVLHELKQQPTLPDSGAGLLSTHQRKYATMSAQASMPDRGEREEQASEEGLNEHPPVAACLPAQIRASAQIERLRGLGYVEAVLWLIVRVADGLAHAHERGILHQDLKPANILLGDDGEPLLLDFNLATDTKIRGTASSALIGGTLPYMSPEHLHAFWAGDRALDARCDLYSVGVILFELLTGKQPFETPTGAVREMLLRMIADRRGPVPTLRPWNAQISPAVESIVRHCLEPDPSHRYRSARELQEDLERQLDDLPLKHVREPSVRERIGKWIRRNRRLASVTTVVGVATCLLAFVTAGFLVRQRHLGRLEASDSLHRLSHELQQVNLMLGSRVASRQEINEGIDLCRQVLGRYHVLDDPSWRDRPIVRHLQEDERDRLRQEVGQLLLLYTRAITWQVETTTDLERRSERHRFASKLNALAESCYGETAPTRALWRQRAELARLSGNGDESQQLRVRAEAIPLRTPMDRFWDVLDRLDRTEPEDLETEVGKRRTLMAEVQQISRVDPQNFVNWLLLGNCYVRLKQLHEAKNCYTTGIALEPELSWSYVNRGLVHLDLNEFSDALLDFDRVIALRPDMIEAYINRALARMGLANFTGAVADLSRALDNPDAPVRAFFLRARAREQLGDREGAANDRALGLARQPSDELSWVVRGLAHLPANPRGALSDFDAALALNPRSRSALQNKAHVLSEQLGRPEEAIRALDTALQYYPDSGEALGGRGVLLARLGRRDAALADARAALAVDNEVLTIYQVAGIYALTSKEEADDRREALRLLAIALRRDPAWLKVIPVDHDLDPIRDHPEFRALLRAVAVVSGAGVAGKG